MRHNLFAIAFLFLVNASSYAQLRNEKTINNASLRNFNSIKLTKHGAKYMKVDYENHFFEILNTDYSLFKKIQYPEQTSHRYIVLAISDNLFDLDDEIEYMILSDWNEDMYMYIYNEDGTVILHETNCWVPNDDDEGYAFRKIKTIVHTDNGLKLIVYYTDSTVKIFALPQGAAYE